MLVKRKPQNGQIATIQRILKKGRGGKYDDRATLGNKIFSFGKYKGYAFGEIIVKDKKYMQWVAENVSNNAAIDVENFLNYTEGN